jgi:hypothetical protein
VSNRSAAHTAARDTREQARIRLAFTILAVSAVFLQKFGFSLAGGALGLDALILWGVVLWLFASGSAVIEQSRFVPFVAMLFAIALSLAVGTLGHQEVKSYPALIIFLAMYATMLFRVDVDRATFLSCLKNFQLVMMIVAWIVIGQQILQYTVGNKYWPNLDRLVPASLLIQGYAYIRPYAWNSPYLTPNGIFFLEPSSASGFLALALAAEIVWFQRIKSLALLGVALIAGMAGSGPTIIALFSPLLFFKMGARLRRWAIGLGLPLLLIAGAAGALSHFTQRTAEFSHDNSSAYARIVVPFESTVTLAENQDYLVTGNGPGSSPKGDNQVQWPANKLIFEYGLLTALLFHVFLVLAILGFPASRTMASIVLIPHLFFGGGFVSHTNIMLLVMFGSLIRLDRVGDRKPFLSEETKQKRFIRWAAAPRDYVVPSAIGCSDDR